MGRLLPVPSASELRTARSFYQSCSEPGRALPVMPAAPPSTQRHSQSPTLKISFFFSEISFIFPSSEAGSVPSSGAYWLLNANHVTSVLLFQSLAKMSTFYRVGNHHQTLFPTPFMYVECSKFQRSFSSLQSSSKAQTPKENSPLNFQLFKPSLSMLFVVSAKENQSQEFDSSLGKSSLL